MAKFEPGQIVYYHLVPEDSYKYFEMEVAEMDGEQYFNGYVTQCRGYEDYEIGQYCEHVNCGAYTYVDKKDIIEQFHEALKKLEACYGKV